VDIYAGLGFVYIAKGGSSFFDTLLDSGLINYGEVEKIF
jgi:hypothetical protein